MKPGTVTHLLRFRTAYVGAILIFGYWPVAVLTNNESSLEFLRAVQVAVASAVLFAYGAEGFFILRRPYVNGDDQLILGIILSWLSVAMQGVWVLLWRVGGKPPWMLDSDFIGFILWLAILGATLHVTSPGVINGEVPRRNWIAAGVAFGIGVMVGAAMLKFRPEVGGFLEYIRDRLASRLGIVL